MFCVYGAYNVENEQIFYITNPNNSWPNYELVDFQQ